MYAEKRDYKCYICGKKGVKRWRPYGDSDPFICAQCAEKRQIKMQYNKRIWSKNPDGTVEGVRTFRWMPLPIWTVNEDGLVPSYEGPNQNGENIPSTPRLIIYLERGISERHSGKTELLPAIPHKNGGVWTYVHGDLQKEKTEDLYSKKSSVFYILYYLDLKNII